VCSAIAAVCTTVADGLVFAGCLLVHSSSTNSKLAHPHSTSSTSCTLSLSCTQSCTLSYFRSLSHTLVLHGILSPHSASCCAFLLPRRFPARCPSPPAVASGADWWTQTWRHQRTLQLGATRGWSQCMAWHHTHRLCSSASLASVLQAAATGRLAC
jgi:hypothetical protein